MQRLLLIVIVVIAATTFAGGCSTLGYYWQSVDGQMQIFKARQSIAAVIGNPSTPPALRDTLTRVIEIRDFASRELKLPENLSYRGYANVRRSFVVWNVFAAEEFSIEPRQWCFPIAGCVGYRGYFAQADAENFANEQRGQGLDVYIGGVPAYSTLGWFDDPVLNTVINYPEHELARLIFHELAHQTVYVKNDSEFNESFAVTVELEAVRRWIAMRGDDTMRAAFERSQRRRAQFTALVLKYRGELGSLYTSRLDASAKRERKVAAFAAMKGEYLRLQGEWDGYSGYDRFFNNINNANLASVAIYNALVPQFQQMLARRNGNLAAFYSDVKALAALGKDERAAQLAAVLASQRAPL